MEKETQSWSWESFWDEKATLATDFEATGRGQMSIQGFLHTVREIAYALELEKNDKVLDIGCGAGIVALALCPFVQSVQGVDLSAKLIERADKNAISVDNVNFIQGNILELGELVCAEYNKLCAYSVLQYLRDEDEVKNAFAQVYSILEEGGLAFFGANPDPERFEAYMNEVRSRGTSPQELVRYQEILDATLWLSSDVLIELAQEVGFDARVEPIDENIWQHFYMFNLILSKKAIDGE